MEINVLVIIIVLVNILRFGEIVTVVCIGGSFGI